eukprot:1149884-Rhodomonas_salina.1
MLLAVTCHSKAVGFHVLSAWKLSADTCRAGGLHLLAVTCHSPALSSCQLVSDAGRCSACSGSAQ